MASSLDTIDKMPVWQRLLLWIIIAAALVVSWFFLFYGDAVDARGGAEVALNKAVGELGKLEKKKENFLEEQRQHEERKAKLREKMEILPMSSSTVDNLMQTFQQKARQVGMSFDSWTNETEQRQDVYARLPVKVSARGTWAQTGEFFRQLSELRQPVSIENISLVSDAANQQEDGDHPDLKIEFEAATYRALSGEERNATTTTGNRPTRRKGAGK